MTPLGFKVGEIKVSGHTALYPDLIFLPFLSTSRDVGSFFGGVATLKEPEGLISVGF